MKVLAVDPGPDESAWVLYENGRPVFFAKEGNLSVLAQLRAYSATHYLAIEMIASYGMPVGAEVFETCVWIGRFIQTWGGPFSLVYRKDVKMHLCGQTAKVNDAVIRRALIDRFGPEKRKAIGTRSAPGPLFGVKGDVWQALAVAVFYADVHGRKAA